MDPIAEAADENQDLYDISTWEARTRLDHLAVIIFKAIVYVSRALVVLLALGMLVTLVLLGALGVLVERPIVTVLISFSALPALGLAVYVWYSDPTTSEPIWLLTTAFVLGLLFANFAAVINGLTEPLLTWIPVIGLPLFFYLVVAPVEETVKLLAVRLSAFESDAFDSVIDGAVYGAFAGLGFATIENALYVSQGYLSSVQGPTEASIIGMVVGTAAVRSLAGPGHVIYSAIAGYYLGLAKFTREYRGPIIVKGLLIAAVIHGTYNSLAGVVPTFLGASLDIPSSIAFLIFIIGFDGLFIYVLYRKLNRYRSLYRGVSADAKRDIERRKRP